MKYLMFLLLLVVVMGCDDVDNKTSTKPAVIYKEISLFYEPDEWRTGPDGPFLSLSDEHIDGLRHQVVVDGWMFDAPNVWRNGYDTLYHFEVDGVWLDRRDVIKVYIVRGIINDPILPVN